LVPSLPVSGLITPERTKAANEKQPADNLKCPLRTPNRPLIHSGAEALAGTLRGLALREIRPRHWPRAIWKETSAGFLNSAVAVRDVVGLVSFLGIATLMSGLPEATPYHRPVGRSQGENQPENDYGMNIETPQSLWRTRNDINPATDAAG
jgi:hypothetical protein